MSLFSLNDIKIDLLKSVFSEGEIVTGKIITYLPNPTKISSICLSFYGVLERTLWGSDTRIIFSKYTLFLAKDRVCSSWEYPFSFQIPMDILPSDTLTDSLSYSWGNTWWQKIGEDILSEITGYRELRPSFRFFLDAEITIPWWVDVARSTEITIDPSLWVSRVESL